MPIEYVLVQVSVFYYVRSKRTRPVSNAILHMSQTQGGSLAGQVVRAPDLKSLGRWFWPLADVNGSPEFIFSATLVNIQLVCFPPVGILNIVMFIWMFIYHCLFTSIGPEKPQWGVANYVYTVHFFCPIQPIGFLWSSELYPIKVPWLYLKRLRRPSRLASSE